MREANILYLVVSKFCDVDLHPNTVPNEQMGLIFENLIRRFNELANETAGDHFTPREVIRLMVSILFIHDDKLLATPGTVRKLLDPACGTGGMLAEAQNYLREHHARGQALRLRAGLQQARLRHRGVRHADEAGGPQRRRQQRPLRRQLHRGPVRGRDLRLLPHQSALRRGLEEAAEGDPAASTTSAASTAASAPGCRA